MLFMKKELKRGVQKALLGFAAGVMVAASVWSLLIPAMDMSGRMGRFAFFPAAVGFLVGIGFLLFLDRAIPHMHIGSEDTGGDFKRSSFCGTFDGQCRCDDSGGIYAGSRDCHSESSRRIYCITACTK